MGLSRFCIIITNDNVDGNSDCDCDCDVDVDVSTENLLISLEINQIE